MLRVSAVLLTAVFGLATASPAVAAGEPGASPASLPLCDTAAALTADGLPREAVGLLTGAGGASCPAELKAAGQATAAAAALAARAVALSAADGDPSWATVDDLLTRAEALDQAVGTGSGDTPSRAAIDALGVQADTALGTAGADKLSRSWIEGKKSLWSSFADPYLTSAVTLLLVVLGTMALVVALGRLLVLLPLTNSWSPIRNSRRRARTWVPVAAWAVALVAGAYAALVLPTDVAVTTTDGWALAMFTALVVAGGLLMWWTLATRMRISVSVAGKSDDAGASEVIALLRELGAEGPAGLEIPQGTDVDVLSGKNIVDKPSGWISSVVSVVQSILGFTPWRVVINENTDDDETYVIITRNGRSHASALITGKPWGEGGPAVDRSKMAAAFVLTSLAEGYATSDFDGLAGATDWRSVGYQYVASSSDDLGSDERKFLCLQAVDADPGNKLAQITLAHQQFRASEDAKELAAYRDWLLDAANGLGTLRALKLRLRYTALAVSVNCDALLGWGPRTTWSSVMPSTATIEAAQALRESLEENQDLRFAGSVAAAAAPILVFTHVWLPAAFARIPVSPTRIYNAVGIESLMNSPYDPASRGSAQIDALAKVTALDGDRDEAWADPTFKILRELPGFATELGNPPLALTDVQPFARYGDTLTALGLETLEKLRDTLLSASDLGHALGITPLACHRLLSAADTIALIASPDLKPLRLDIFAALWDEGIHNIQELRRADPRDAETLANVICSRIKEGRRPSPNPLAVEAWILQMREPVPPRQGAESETAEASGGSSN